MTQSGHVIKLSGCNLEDMKLLVKKIIPLIVAFVIGVITALSNWAVTLFENLLPNTTQIACASFQKCHSKDWNGWIIDYPNTSDAYLISATGFKYEICFDAGNGKTNPVVLIDNGNRFSKNNPGAKILESSCIITEIEDGPNLGIFIDTNNGATKAWGRYRILK